MSESRALMAEFSAGLDRIGPGLTAALPEHVTPDRFKRVVMTAVQQNQKLLAPGLRSSLFMACLRAAQDGLQPDGREGALVIQKVKGVDTVAWWPMIGGILKLVRNSGDVGAIQAQVVYEGEPFRVVLGDQERIEHERRMDLPATAKPVAAYAVATLRDGTKVREVMTAAQLAKVRAVSRSGEDGPWGAWPDEMMRKTVLRRLAKRLPLSTDRDGDSRLRSAIERVDEETVLAGAGMPALAATSRLDALEAMIEQTGEPELVSAEAAEAAPAEADGGWPGSR